MTRIDGCTKRKGLGLSSRIAFRAELSAQRDGQCAHESSHVRGEGRGGLPRGGSYPRRRRRERD
jgi:hypothetical protein